MVSTTTARGKAAPQEPPSAQYRLRKLGHSLLLRHGFRWPGQEKTTKAGKEQENEQKGKGEMSKGGLDREATKERLLCGKRHQMSRRVEKARRSLSGARRKGEKRCKWRSSKGFTRDPAKTEKRIPEPGSRAESRKSGARGTAANHLEMTSETGEGTSRETKNFLGPLELPPTTLRLPPKQVKERAEKPGTPRGPRNCLQPP